MWGEVDSCVRRRECAKGLVHLFRMSAHVSLVEDIHCMFERSTVPKHVRFTIAIWTDIQNR